jgi:putative transposase
VAKNRAPRLPAFTYVGPYRYSLTVCTRERRSLFVETSLVTSLIVQIRHSCETEGFSVIAYCFMPDHLHLLAEGTQPDSDLRQFMKKVKQRTAFVWKQDGGGVLWQRSYYDHVLRDEEDTFRVARYILGNPVRAGLVARPQDYPFSGSLVMDMRDLLWSL